MPQQNLWEAIQAAASEKRRRVAIGINKITPKVVDSLNRAKRYVDIVVVGKKMEGFDSIECDNLTPMIQMAKDGTVDAVVRGNFDALDAYNALKEVFNIQSGILEINFFKLNGIKMIDDSKQGVFCLLPASFVNERTYEDKIKSINLHLDFFKKIGIEPKLGILGPGKLIDKQENIPEVTAGLEEAENLVTHYSEQGVWGKFFNHQIEYAAMEANIIVAQNSWAGNLAAHCLLYFGTCDYLGGAALNIPEIVYVDDSEAMQDFENCLLFASYLAAQKSHEKPE